MKLKNIKLKNKVSIKNLINDETKVELFGLIFVIETLMIMITLIFQKSFIASITATIAILLFSLIGLKIFIILVLFIIINLIKENFEFIIKLLFIAFIIFCLMTLNDLEKSILTALFLFYIIKSLLFK